MRNADANWLTVDAGNYVDRAGTSGGCTNKCAFMISSYEDLYYDVLNLGRSEVFMGYETIKTLQDSAKKGTEFVSANLLDKKSGKPIVKPYVIKDYGNMRVAVIGLLNEIDFTTASAMDTTRFKVAPYIETAKKYIPSLAKSCNAVIVLGDLATAAIDTLVKKVPGIDFVISTGSVSSGEALTKIGNARVISPGTSGYNGHYTMLEFNPAWKDSIAFADTSIPLDEAYDETGKWTERLAAFQANPNANAMAIPAKSSVAPAPASPKTVAPQPSAQPQGKQVPPTAAKPSNG